MSVPMSILAGPGEGAPDSTDSDSQVGESFEESLDRLMGPAGAVTAAEVDAAQGLLPDAPAKQDPEAAPAPEGSGLTASQLDEILKKSDERAAAQFAAVQQSIQQLAPQPEVEAPELDFSAIIPEAPEISENMTPAEVREAIRQSNAQTIAAVAPIFQQAITNTVEEVTTKKTQGEQDFRQAIQKAIPDVNEVPAEVLQQVGNLLASNPNFNALPAAQRAKMYAENINFFRQHAGGRAERSNIQTDATKPTGGGGVAQKQKPLGNQAQMINMIKAFNPALAAKNGY